MVTLRVFLEGQRAPIHTQHLRGHSKLPGFLSMRNNWADQLATGPQALTLQEATQVQYLTISIGGAYNTDFPRSLL